MIVTCWSVKGGSGTSVVAAALAVCLAESTPVLAVDLAGDLPSVLGSSPGDGPGVVDWLHASGGVGGAALEALATEAAPGLRVVHRGRGDVAPSARWEALATALAAVSSPVVIDAGTAPPHPAVAAASTESLLVLRPCFLGLRRASLCTSAPTGVVLVAEPGRSLGRADVERVTSVRVLGEVPLDPAIARAVDCGILSARVPGSLRRAIAGVQRSLDPATFSGLPA